MNYELWSKEKVIEACKIYLKTHKKITQKDLKKENGLPTSKVIYNFFGTMQSFQEENRLKYQRQEFISQEEILIATKEIVQKVGSIFESRNAFLEVFPYSYQ